MITNRMVPYSLYNYGLWYFNMDLKMILVVISAPVVGFEVSGFGFRDLGSGVRVLGSGLQ